jgi:hypothetical protein
MKCLIKENILQLSNFSDLGHCVECIKEKFVKYVKKSGVTHSSGVLEIIHTNICGSFNVTIVNDFNSFITFTNDFSQYGSIKLHLTVCFCYFVPILLSLVLNFYLFYVFYVIDNSVRV